MLQRLRLVRPVGFACARSSSTTPATRRRSGAIKGPVSSVNFSFQIIRALDKIHHALLVGIVPANTSYKLSRSAEPGQESIALDAGDKGSYVFTVDWKLERLTVQTPISGVRQYEYEPLEDVWLNTVDGHDMRGLVTRDLLRHSRGCPTF